MIIFIHLNITIFLIFRKSAACCFYCWLLMMHIIRSIWIQVQVKNLAGYWAAEKVGPVVSWLEKSVISDNLVITPNSVVPIEEEFI